MIWQKPAINVPLITEWWVLRGASRELVDLASGEETLVFYIDYPHLPNRLGRFLKIVEIDKMGED